MTYTPHLGELVAWGNTPASYTRGTFVGVTKLGHYVCVVGEKRTTVAAASVRPWASCDPLCVYLPRGASWASSNPTLASGLVKEYARDVEADGGGPVPDNEDEWWAVVATKSRDSGQLTVHNYDSFAKLLRSACDELPEGAGRSYLHMYDLRFNHWAVGWVDYLLVKVTSPLWRLAVDTVEKLNDYPILDEDGFNEFQWSNRFDEFCSYASYEFRRELNKMCATDKDACPADVYTNEQLFRLFEYAETDSVLSSLDPEGGWSFDVVGAASIVAERLNGALPSFDGETTASSDLVVAAGGTWED